MTAPSPLSLPHEWIKNVIAGGYTCSHCLLHESAMPDGACELRTLRAQVEIARKLESAADAVIEAAFAVVVSKEMCDTSDEFTVEALFRDIAILSEKIESLRAARKGGG
jgi:hypothetical protein